MTGISKNSEGIRTIIAVRTNQMAWWIPSADGWWNNVTELEDNSRIIEFEDQSKTAWMSSLWSLWGILQNTDTCGFLELRKISMGLKGEFKKQWLMVKNSACLLKKYMVK